MDKELKKELLEIAKSEGLDIAEETLVALTRVVFKIIKTAVPKVSFGLGSIIVPLVDTIEPKVLALIDKLDGEDDPEY